MSLPDHSSFYVRPLSRIMYHCMTYYVMYDGRVVWR